MRRNLKKIGGPVLLALMLSGAWYCSQDDTLACVAKLTASQGGGAKLNLYRVCRVNGVAGVAGFLMAMPDSPTNYDTCWQRALDWVWSMRYPFSVPEVGDFYKWPQKQGDDTSRVVVRQHAGIGSVFMDAYNASSDTMYRNHAIDVARYLMLNDEGQYVVMQDTSDESSGDMVFWQFWDDHGSPAGQVRRSYDGGISAIGLYFLKMYYGTGSAAYYDVARRASRYLKYVAITGSTAVGDTLWAKWRTTDQEADTSYIPTSHCEGAAGIVTFLDSMYIAASDSGDTASTSDLLYARAGLQWLKGEAQETTIGGERCYWWYQIPDRTDEDPPDTTYSPVWGRGAAGIGETFLMAYTDFAADSAESVGYYRYAKGAALWVASKGEDHSDGKRWRYMYGDTTGDTLYYSYFCKGQGPVISFFAELYDESRDYPWGDDSSSFYLACARDGWQYLDSTKVPGYEGGACWDGIGFRPEKSDSDYIPLSVSFENGPPGLGIAMLQTARFIGSATSADSADSAAFMELAFDCANWLKYEVHIDSVFPRNDVGGNKWSWRVAEDSITVEIVNKSACGDPCILDSFDTFECSLYVYSWKGETNPVTVSVFWWVDFLRWNKRFFTVFNPEDPQLDSRDSGTVILDGTDTAAIYVFHHMKDFSLPSDPTCDTTYPVSVNGSAGFWLTKGDEGDTFVLYSLDQDCFRMFVIDSCRSCE